MLVRASPAYLRSWLDVPPASLRPNNYAGGVYSLSPSSQTFQPFLDGPAAPSRFRRWEPKGGRRGRTTKMEPNPRARSSQAGGRSGFCGLCSSGAGGAVSHAGCSVWKYWKKGRKKKRRFACCLSGTGAPFHFWSRRRSPTGRFGELGGVDEGISAVGGKGMRTSCVSRDQSTNRSSATVAEAGTDGLLRGGTANGQRSVQGCPTQ